jgi:hypothetical protein
MYEHEANGKPIEAGIISFKNLKSGFYLLILKRKKKKVNVL